MTEGTFLVICPGQVKSTQYHLPLVLMPQMAVLVGQLTQPDQSPQNRPLPYSVSPLLQEASRLLPAVSSRLADGSLDLNLTPVMKDPVPQYSAEIQEPMSPTRDVELPLYSSLASKHFSSMPLRAESSTMFPRSGSIFSMNPWAQELSGQNDSEPHSPHWLLAWGLIET